MSFVTFLFAHKLVALLVVVTSAFVISTIVLGVENADLKNQSESSSTEALPPTTTSKTTSQTTGQTTEPPTEPPEDMSKYRLPETASPITYDLYLYPDLGTGLFRGRVEATIRVVQNTPEIVLNTHLLNITDVKVDKRPGKFTIDQEYERLTISKEDGSHFQQSTTTLIEIDYEGDMKNRIVGLYRSSYINSENEIRYMATSKFEPTYARQAFPCFDEPNMKATYKVHLLKPNNTDYIALSNNPEETADQVDDGIMVHFKETVPMSTYLSCFIVSDFKYTSNSFNNKGSTIPFRVYASPGQLEKTNYAGDVGKKVIEFYINYFDIPYPLPKLDMVAVPDFVSGAMEHWGLVTYRETALLFTNETHSSGNKQRVATVVAHELAHSWFGNLVTMNWWSDLWLNEGFASYIEYKGVNHAEPTWGMLDQFLISDLHSVLILDATQGSHPIIKTVTTPDEITEVFDAISYNKGAAVLRMLESAVGEKNFRGGVTNYLNKHAFKNAVTQDLWDEIQTVVGPSLNVTEFMDTFTVQMGYPIITIRMDGEKYVLSQKRFLIDPETAGNGPSSPLDYKWTIPVTYVTNLNKSEVHWFDKSTTLIEINKPVGATYLKFNPDHVGYYRVNYPENEWEQLISSYKTLSISDRTHLLEESFSIAESGDLSYKVPLNLTRSLEDEFDYVPWTVASTFLSSILKKMRNTQYESDFENYIVKVLTPAYDKLQWVENPEDDHLTRLARTVVLKLACVVNHQGALKEAKDRFDQWLENGTVPLSQDLRGIIYQYGMIAHTDEATWMKLFDKFAAETDANEKLKLMIGLSCVRNPALLNRLIELAEDETYVRSQDYFSLLSYISMNPIGRPIVWDYVREHWNELVKRFTLNDRYLGRLIPSITSSFSTATKLDEMTYFFSKYPEAGAGVASRMQALETVRNNIKWLAKYKAIVVEWIVQNK